MSLLTLERSAFRRISISTFVLHGYDGYIGRHCDPMISVCYVTTDIVLDKDSRFATSSPRLTPDRAIKYKTPITPRAHPNSGMDRTTCKASPLSTYLLFSDAECMIIPAPPATHRKNFEPPGGVLPITHVPRKRAVDRLDPGL